MASAGSGGNIRRLPLFVLGSEGGHGDGQGKSSTLPWATQRRRERSREPEPSPHEVRVL